MTRCEILLFYSDVLLHLLVPRFTVLLNKISFIVRVQVFINLELHQYICLTHFFFVFFFDCSEHAAAALRNLEKITEDAFLFLS